MRFPVDRALAGTALILTSACSVIPHGHAQHAAGVPLADRWSAPAAENLPPVPQASGDAISAPIAPAAPAAYSPYDAVGYAVAAGEGAAGITASHPSLPVPSYVEVTNLDTGKTVLALVNNSASGLGATGIALSPAALAALDAGGSGRVPVRVRRVLPPESEQAMLRGGQPGPARMDAPAGLLSVLRKRLAASGGEVLTKPAANPGLATAPTAAPAVPPPAAAVPNDKPAHPAKPPRHAPPPRPATASSAGSDYTQPAQPQAAASPPPANARAVPLSAVEPRGSIVIQLAAFSDRDRAMAYAAQTHAHVVPGRGVYRVRLGPYRSEAQAAADLAHARAAGYSTARIEHVN